MTCIGIALYLMHLQNFNLGILTLVVFAPLIGFHFAITKLSKMEDCDSIGAVRNFVSLGHEQRTSKRNSRN